MNYIYSPVLVNGYLDMNVSPAMKFIQVFLPPLLVLAAKLKFLRYRQYFRINYVFGPFFKSHVPVEIGIFP